MAHKSDQHIINTTHNTARFFVENRHIAWVLLVGTMIWGAFGFISMPQRKDPEVPVRIAVALVPWPGASVQRVEHLITEQVEAAVAGNRQVTKIDSISRTGLSVVYVELDENVKDAAKEFDDVKMRLDAIGGLPDGAGPINFIKDFGDTAALMLTVASPKVSGPELDLRIRDTRAAIESVRSQRRGAAPPGQSAFSIVQHYPRTLNPKLTSRPVQVFVAYLEQHGLAQDVRMFEGAGFGGVDGFSALGAPDLLQAVERFKREKLHVSEFHPDGWETLVFGSVEEIAPKMTAAAGDKYTYREMEEFTEEIQKQFQTLEIVSKVDRSGILPERILLAYSQERLAAYGLRGGTIDKIINSQNILQSGGSIEAGARNIYLDPSGEFKNEDEIGNVVVATSQGGAPVYLRDLGDIVRDYQTPAQFLNFYNHRDEKGQWHRNRAITLSLQMRSGKQIGEFGMAVDAKLAELKHRLPDDLIMARTSDQPLQVEEKIDLFSRSLEEAIVLVVLISWIGFWEWRSALLMALSIPLTLAMTFGMMHMLGIDLQQVSIAALIIALGLLVDDPVVAGDAIKRERAAGHNSLTAAWLGPTKLATAIMFATLTNIVAYAPFVLLTGDMGRFMYSLAVVMTCSLVASRLVSMTFIPLLGHYLLKAKKEPTIEERRSKGFASWYYRVGGWAIDHRWKVAAGSLVFLLLGGVIASQLKPQFLPKDLSYLSYVDVWLPDDAPLSATNQIAARAEQIIRDEAAKYGAAHPDDDGKAREMLHSLTTFVGGGGPRFWFSVSPELQQLNYAQIIIQTKSNRDTDELVAPLQKALSAGITGARVDVRQLESGAAVGIPVSIRISGHDIATIRKHAERVKDILREVPTARRIRDDWGTASISAQLETDTDRANLAGVTNMDVAGSAAVATTGNRVSTLREGDKQIPIVTKLRMEERAQLSDVDSLYVWSSSGSQKVPLSEVASISYSVHEEKIRRRRQYRTITVSAFPAEGYLASEVLMAAMPKLKELESTLPAGYQLELAGEYEEQQKGFLDLIKVMAISIAAIFLALVFQFRHAVKPLLVFAAIPYGMVGALAGLWAMGAPFGFTALLGIASLIGVIVSHVIVLFDFIEEAHERGESLRDSLLDAGIVRLRPVLITVAATVIALIPLARNGGPLWEPLCYAQIGGLTIATFVTLILVPVLYAIFVWDLKWVKWEEARKEEEKTIHVTAAVA